MRTIIALLLLSMLVCSAQIPDEVMQWTLLKATNTPASGAWIPTSVSGLEGWWKTDAGAYQDAGTTPCANNTKVYQWNDQSGKGINAVQTTSGSRGTWFTNYQNGLPIIALNSSWMAITVSLAAGSRTFFCVYSNNSTTANQWLFDAQTGRLVATPFSQTSGKTGWYDGSWKEITGGPSAGWHSWIFVLPESGTGRVYVDGTEIGSGAAYNSTAIGGSVAIWARYDGSSAPLLGWMGEMGFYSVALTDGERGSLQTYLKNRWATP